MRELARNRSIRAYILKKVTAQVHVDLHVDTFESFIITRRNNAGMIVMPCSSRCCHEHFPRELARISQSGRERFLRDRRAVRSIVWSAIEGCDRSLVNILMSCDLRSEQTTSKLDS